VVSLLEKTDADTDLYGDSAYRSAQIEQTLKKHRVRSRIHEKAYRNQPLTKAQMRSNRAKSRIRARVELAPPRNKDAPKATAPTRCCAAILNPKPIYRAKNGWVIVAYVPCFTGWSCSISMYCSLRIAFQRSQSSCSPSQNSADIPSTLASLSAVSGVTPRLPLTISFRRGNETPSLTAKSDWVIPIGFKNSSSNISPGWVGTRFLGSLVVIVLPARARKPGRPLDLVVVDNLDFICSPILPAETDTILLVDSDAHLTFPVVLQFLQHVPRRNSKISQLSSSVDLVKPPLSDRPQVRWASFPCSRGLKPVVEIFGSLVPEGPYHGSRYTI